MSTRATSNIALGQECLRLGRDASVAQVALNHCHVSRCHAEIIYAAGQYVLRDLGSANGTLLNGRAIRGRALLEERSQIRIGPYALEFAEGKLTVYETTSRGKLVCKNVSRFPRGGFGKRARILSDISLAIHPAEFVCLLGPTGSGKSTLLSAMCLRNPADEGEVWLDDLNLMDNFDFLKNRIAVVPQREILHADLTICQALKFTAGLRLPPDTSVQEINQLVHRMCALVGLTDHQHKLFRNLSGGQAKRACLANEMIANPEILFLDEVTAGLDEQTDREIMRLFRQIADTGKTVVAVTHNLAHIEENCDLLVILTAAGHLAFVGTPPEALAYFEVNRLGDIYPLLTKSPERDWVQLFLDSPEYEQHIAGRLTDQANHWMPPQVKLANRESAVKLASRFARQTRLQVTRAVSIKLADWQSSTALGLQCLLVAVLIFTLFGNLHNITPETIERAAPSIPPALGETLVRSDYSMKVLFLVAVCAFWFGCNNASKELVVERDIYTRERDVNLTVEAYLASKLVLLCAISLAQAILLYALCDWLCALDGAHAASLLLLSLTAIGGVGVGLCISSISQSEDMAVKLVPICLIPQIILGGILAPITGIASWLVACFIPTYWCFTSACDQLPAELKRHLTIDLQDWWISIAALVVQAGAAIVVTWSALRYQQSRDGLYEYGIKQLSRGGKGCFHLVTKVRPAYQRFWRQALPVLVASTLRCRNKIRKFAARRIRNNAGQLSKPMDS